MIFPNTESFLAVWTASSQITNSQTMLLLVCYVNIILVPKYCHLMLTQLRCLYPQRFYNYTAFFIIRFLTTSTVYSSVYIIFAPLFGCTLSKFSHRQPDITRIIRIIICIQTEDEKDNIITTVIHTRLHKPVTDWLKTLPHSSDGLNM